MEENTEKRVDLTLFSEKIQELKDRIASVIVGQEQMVDLVLTAVLANGHVLIEGVPGVAKTLLARLVARLVDADFSRIQFTPDLMPADITGTNIIVKTDAGNEFRFREGPLFASIVLADEINRATPKTQAALLEAMQEHSVTVGGETHALSEPYFVLATQNPVDFVGTYPLPEAQLDRFFMKISIGYPTAEEEAAILERQATGQRPIEDLRAICTGEDIVALQGQVNSVYASPEVRAYIARICQASRKHAALQLGISTRGAIFLLRSAQACALLAGRDYVIPEDVQKMAAPVLAHRIQLSPEARMRNMTPERALSSVMSGVQVPVKV